jgi:MFS family permease
VRSGRRDVIATSILAFLFTVGSGMAAILLPLIALGSGLGVTEIGVAATAGASVQIVAKSCLGRVMRYVTDRALLVVGAVAQLASFAVVLAATSFEVLTVAWVLQGIARSCFWTCGQTHVVRRGSGSAVRSLAGFNFVGGVGQFVGPLVAGFVAASNMSLALAVGALISGTAILPALALEHHDPFAPPENPRTSRLLREPGMAMACWGSVGAGVWRSLMDSFVPVILEGARYSSTAIGALVSISNGAAILGALVVGRMRRAAERSTYVWTMIAISIGVGSVGLVADITLAAASALAAAGFAAGILQTVSPAIASSSVLPHERGEAIAMSGAARSVAMLGGPLVVTVVAMMAPVSTGLLAAGLALSLPALMEARRL